jgi:hypothetical protein
MDIHYMIAVTGVVTGDEDSTGKTAVLGMSHLAANSVFAPTIERTGTTRESVLSLSEHGERRPT